MLFSLTYVHSAASQVAQLSRICLQMQETWCQSLGGEDTLEKEMATHSSILASEIPRTKESGGLQPMGHKESDTTQRLKNNNRLH